MTSSDLQLTGSQTMTFAKAIVAAFATFKELAQFTEYALDTPLENVTAPDGLNNVVFSLLAWSRANGVNVHMLRQARRFRSGNAELQAFEVSLFASVTTEALDELLAALGPVKQEDLLKAYQHARPREWNGALRATQPTEQMLEIVDRLSAIPSVATSRHPLAVFAMELSATRTSNGAAIQAWIDRVLPLQQPSSPPTPPAQNDKLAVPSDVTVEGILANMAAFEARQKLARLAKLYGEVAMSRRFDVPALRILIASDLRPFVVNADDQLTPAFLQRVRDLRSDIYSRFGIWLGSTVSTEDASLPKGTYILAVRDIPRSSGNLNPAKGFCVASVDRVRAVANVAAASSPDDGAEAAWVEREDWDRVSVAGFEVLDAAGYMVLHLRRVIRENLRELVEFQEVVRLIERSEQRLARIRASTGGLPRFMSLLCGLLAEQVSVRDLAAIATCYLQRHPQPMWEILEHVRALPTIRETIPGNENGMSVFRLGPKLLAEIVNGRRRSGDGTTLGLEPVAWQRCMNAIVDMVKTAPTRRGEQHVILVDDPMVRALVPTLLMGAAPGTVVISSAEVADASSLVTIATIELSN